MISILGRCLAVAVLWLACVGLAQGQGRALQFAGDGDRVDAPLPAIFDSIDTTDFTITTRVRIDQSPTSAARILFAQLDASNAVSLLVNSQNVVYAFVLDAGTHRSLAAANSIATGQWAEVAVRWTAATNTVELLVDGVPASDAGGSTSVGVNGVMTLGARTDGAQTINGALDDFAIWPTVLDDAELATVWSGLCLSGSTPAVRYDFEVGQPGGTNTGLTTLPDLGPDGDDGTLLGFALSGVTSNWIASPYAACAQSTAVSLAVNDAPDPVAAGAALTWNVDIGVAGAPASAVVLTGEVPAPAQFASLSAPPGLSCTTPAVGASGPVSCTAALLSEGMSSLVLVASVAADAVANSLIEADWSVSALGDTDPSDDTASTTTTIANQLLLVDDAAVTAFEQTVAIDVLANDGVAAGGAALDGTSLQVATGPGNGSASCTAPGCTYLPDTGFSGVDAFDYTVCDGSAVPVCGTAAVRVAVGPAAGDDAFATAQATTLLASVAGNDSFPATAQFSVQSLPSAGTLSLAADGSFSYAPAPGYAGGDGFAYQVCLAAPDETVCDAASVSLSVNATPLELTPAAGALPPALVDAAYPAVTFSASGGTAPYVFAVVGGALPPGLVLDAGGPLSGTPTAAGSFAFTVGVTDSSSGAGPFHTSASYTLEVAQAAQTIDFPTPPDATGIVGDTLQVMPVASSGLPVTLVSGTPDVCTVSGSGPFEITLLTSGTCTLVASQAGDADTEPAADVIVSFGVSVSPPLVLAPVAGALPPAVVDSAYPAFAFSASGGTAPYVFAVTAGALPPGLALGADGTLSGTPTVVGSFAFTVEVTDSSGGAGPFNDAAPYTLQVAQAAQVIDFPVPPDATGTEGDTLQLAPAASSGLPVTLVSTTPAVCTVSGSGPFEITLLSSGTCTLVASQAGDADTAPAADVIVSFGVIVSPSVPPALPQPAVIPTLDRSWQLAMALLVVLLGGIAARRRS